MEPSGNKDVVNPVTAKQLEWASKPLSPVELPKGIEKNSPREKVLTSVEEIGRKADREISQIDSQFTDQVAEKPAMKKPAEAVLAASTMWEKYLSHQREIEDKMAHLQDQYEAAKAGSKAFGNTSAKPNPQEADRERTAALYQEALDFKFANIPPEMLGIYKIPPELRDKPIAREYMAQVEEWKKFAMAERERMQKDREGSRAPESVKDEIGRLAKKLEEAEKAQAEAIENLAKEAALRIQAEQARDAAIADNQRLRDEAAALARPEETDANQEEANRSGNEIQQQLIQASEHFQRNPVQPSASYPEPTEPPERLVRNNFGERLRRNLDYILGGVTGFVSTEAAAGATLWAFPQLGPIGVELSSVAATLGWTGLWISSEYRRFRERLPQVTRFLRGAVVGSIAGTTINTAASALEIAGITNIMPGWPTPETVQAATQATTPPGGANPPVEATRQALQITVEKGQNLSTIVRDTLHLTNPREIYLHTVETILSNLDKLAPGNSAAVDQLRALNPSPNAVMHDQKLFRLAMEAGRIIQPGQVFTIK